MRFNILIPGIIVLLGLSVGPSCAQEQAKRSTTYEVPTKGKIIDVRYTPEFDEWWVKCREGDGISIYSYDKGSRKWRRALFVPAKGKPKETVKKTDKLQGTDEKAVSADMQPEDPGKKAHETATPPPETGVKAGARKEPAKKEQEHEKKQWWHPLNILKRIEKPATPAK